MGATVITWSVNKPKDQELLNVGLDVPKNVSLEIQPGANPNDGHVKLLVHRTAGCVDTYEVDYDFDPDAPKVRVSGFKCGAGPGSSVQVISVFSKSDKTPWVGELAALFGTFDTMTDPNSLPDVEPLPVDGGAPTVQDAPAAGEMKIGRAPSTGPVADEDLTPPLVTPRARTAAGQPEAVAAATGAVGPAPSQSSPPWLRIGVVSALGAASAVGGWKTRGDHPLPSDGAFAAAGGAGGYALTRMTIGFVAPNWADRHPFWAEAISVVAGGAAAFAAVQGNRSISGRGHQAIDRPDEEMPPPFVDEEAERQPPEAEVTFGD